LRSQLKLFKTKYYSDVDKYMINIQVQGFSL